MGDREEMEKSHLITILVAITIGLSVLNLVFTLGINNKMNTITGNVVLGNDQQNLPTNTAPTKVDVSDDGDPSLGDKNAPITIIEFSDFQCPYCARFHEQTFPELKSKYIDTGKVRFVYRDFPLSFHPNAQKASEAAECANEQGKYWAYYDVLFTNQDALDTASLKQYAADLKLDTAKFDQCLDSGKMENEVNDDLKDGTSYGVSGTPTFYINGIELVGAQPIAAFEQVIDSQLNN